jgi:hypothetical protein
MPEYWRTGYDWRVHEARLAMEVPDLLVRDVRAFFRAVRGRPG